jgi:hypothetical protein
MSIDFSELIVSITLSRYTEACGNADKIASQYSAALAMIQSVAETMKDDPQSLVALPDNWPDAPTLRKLACELIHARSNVDIHYKALDRNEKSIAKNPDSFGTITISGQRIAD